MSTEGKLWETIRRQQDQGVDWLRLTRFESDIALGISDLEYVGVESHGWIELKVGYVPSYGHSTRALRLTEALKFEQQTWLLSHHCPDIGLRSFVLVGLPERNKNGWEGFLILTPSLAVAMTLHHVPWSRLQKRLGFHSFPNLLPALKFIAYT